MAEISQAAAVSYKVEHNNTVGNLYMPGSPRSSRMHVCLQKIHVKCSVNTFCGRNPFKIWDAYHIQVKLLHLPSFLP